MKNQAFGFGALQAVIIVAVVAILTVGSLTFLSNRKSQSISDEKSEVGLDTSADWKIYQNDIYGFKFSYPASWEYTETPTEIRFSEELTNPGGGLGATSYSDGSALAVSIGFPVDDLLEQIAILMRGDPSMQTRVATLNNFLVTKVVSRSRGKAIFWYWFVIDDKGGKLLFTVRGPVEEEGPISARVEKQIETLIVYKKISGGVTEQSRIEVKKGENDMYLRRDLSDFPLFAESYFDKQKYSYKGLCVSNDNALGQHNPALFFSELNKRTSKDHIACRDSSFEYVLAVRLSTGKVYCVDSTGYHDELPELPTASTCK